MNNIEFVNPYLLYLLIAIPLLALWYYLKNKYTQAELTLPFTQSFLQGGNFLARIKPILYILRLTTLSLLIVALARPRSVDVSSKNKKNKGIDIVMSVDVSGSMLAKDLRPNRLEALKKVAKNFVQGRRSDRFGIVAYEGEAFTQCPLTTDHKVVVNAISDLKYGLLEGGTAIGMGLGVSINRLKGSKAKSKVIILLTDGVNTAGSVNPKTASEIAKEKNIKVYTIGIGTNGMAETPVAIDRSGKLIFRMSQVNIDEEILKQIANITGGKYFRATNNEKLKQIYNEIDQLEKTELQELKFYNYDEKYRYLVLIGLILWIIELILKFTIFRSFI